MTDKKLLLPLDVREDLDTAMPISDRKHGVLVSTQDVHARYWGPRRGSQAFTRTWESPGTASLYAAITLNGTNNARARADTYEDAFGDLGTTCVLDFWFRLEDIAYASAVNRIGLYGLVNSSGSGIDVNIMGGASSDHERIEVQVTTSPTRSTTDTTAIMMGSTRISYGTGQTNKHHVRYVRDGAAQYLYLDGVLDASNSGAVSATYPINRTLGALSYAYLGFSNTANISFKGHIYGAVLRDGAFRSQPIEATMPASCWAKNVHHYFLGRNYDLGGGDYHFFDASRFGLHARILYNVAGDITITSSNDNAAPAPAPVQAMRTWTTRTNRTAMSALCGGTLSTAAVS